MKITRGLLTKFFHPEITRDLMNNRIKKRRVNFLLSVLKMRRMIFQFHKMSWNCWTRKRFQALNFTSSLQSSLPIRLSTKTPQKYEDRLLHTRININELGWTTANKLRLPYLGHYEESFQF